MKGYVLYFFIFLLSTGCNNIKNNDWEPYDESYEIKSNENHPIKRMQFKLIQSKFNDKNNWLSNINDYLINFSEDDYQLLKPLIIEQNIPSIQKNILSGKLTYEKLVLFYLYRIKKIEFNKDLYLNSIISLNQNIILEAKEKDKKKPSSTNYF